MVKHSAEYWIKNLQLTPHVEGGAFREIYKSPLSIAAAALPPLFKGVRPASTSIYFLLQQNEYSALHRIASDELWHFYYGDTLIIYEIDESGHLAKHKLGNNFEEGESFQCVIKAGSWFGAKLAERSSYALVGCTVAPGFDFEEFELADKKTLLKQYPHLSNVIDELCG